jgi:hypothetical protein
MLAQLAYLYVIAHAVIAMSTTTQRRHHQYSVKQCQYNDIKLSTVILADPTVSNVRVTDITVT